MAVSRWDWACKVPDEGLMASVSAMYARFDGAGRVAVCSRERGLLGCATESSRRCRADAATALRTR